MNEYFPMFFNLQGKKILVIGAGTVALRRIETLLSFGASIVVAAPDWKIEVEKYRDAGQLILLERSYGSDLIQNEDVKYFMVLAATDCPILNQQICEDGRAAGALVNNASDRSQCDFYFPAIIKQGDLVAGLCAGGKNHSLVRKAAADMRKWIREYKV